MAPSAAVGLLAGAGALAYALLAALMVIAINLLLRPLVERINRRPWRRQNCTAAML
jgi:putative Mg2+ transporter-C (MgtC) family protein